MKRRIEKAKKQFPTLNYGSNELKASSSIPCVKHHILESIVSTDVSIHYIVADLKHIKPTLLEDKNLLYNYLTKILINSIVGNSDHELYILFDNHSTKVGSTNSLKDYIKIFLNYDKMYNLSIDFHFIDSDSGDGFVIQAADYVANAIHAKYCNGNELYYSLIDKKIVTTQEFPRVFFNK